MNRTEEDLREIHEAELKIAVYFKEYCEKKKFHYVMLGGTMLGAVRHRGFIPWDDDMDFGLPRREYDQFVKDMSASDRYTLRNYMHHNSKSYVSELEDRNIDLVDRSASVADIRHPWIDIFPLDKVITDRGPTFLFYRYLLLFDRLMLQYSMFDELVNQKMSGRPLHERVLIRLGRVLKPQRFLDPDKCMARLHRDMVRYKKASKYGFLSNFMGAYKWREMFPKGIYLRRASYPFEDTEFMGPADYDAYLTQLYGDYMTPPKEADRNKHGVYIKETNR